MIKINQLESLKVMKAVVEEGSFTGAAKRLEISAARVSKAIEQLEITLDAVLFKRSTRHMQVTDSGERCYQSALLLLGQWQSLQQELAQSRQKPAGKIRLSIPMTWGLEVFAPLLGEFMQLYPEIEFDTQLNDQQVNLLAGDYDLVLRLTGQLADSSLLCQKITGYRFVVCATPQYLAQYGMPESPTDLSEHACLMYQLPGMAKKWQFLQGNKPLDIYLEPKLVANNSLLIKSALLSHQGLAHIPEFIVADELARGQLNEVLTGFTTPALNLYLLRAKEHSLSYRMQVFIAFLRERLGQSEWSL
ncbi:LysR family transcriptional regulator [Thalassomonas haliotis]|uniref:LysR family transcriptional regulator n=1 Tax=Thalassomonas haliotis TaxID=485448 RepID=A0ABY7VBD3_9GAMM|nr:LysR family transcriptional regulator [Thalassomonas haliotis]WDE10611.1 LysR family transcriptional regulator [Thalassomonas haliotis]